MNYAPEYVDASLRFVTRRDSFRLFLTEFRAPLILGIFFLVAATLDQLYSWGWDAMQEDKKQGQPVVATEAKILAFYPEPAYWNPQQMAEVTFSDGQVVSVVVPSWAWNCRVGETVKMQRQGRLAWVEKPGCTH